MGKISMILAGMALVPKLYTRRIIKIHPNYLFSLVGFGIGSFISLTIIFAEEFNGDVSVSSGHSQIHHLTIPVLFGLFGMFFGYVYGRKSQTKEEAFQEIFDNHQTLNLILDHLPLLISYLDTDLRYRYVNKTYEKWMGLSLNDIYGRLVKDIVVENTYEALIQNIHKAKQGKTVTFDTSRELNGSNRFLHVTLIPHLDENRSVKGFLSVVADVTQLRKRENKIRIQKDKLEELNASKDLFFSIISHDLKNPFNSLLGFSELLHDDFDTLDEAIKKECAGHIYESARNTYELLENLLAWSRAQRGKLDYNPSLVNLKILVDENLRLLLLSSWQKNIRLQSELGEDFRITTDRELVNTVIRNLLTNALKFTSKGGLVNVSARWISKNRAHDFLEVSVTDNGLGIAPGKLNQLFKIGRSESTEGTEGESGTGLGLMLCKEFVEICGGEIIVESEPGKGSIVKFTLPNK
ncbi:histidine kinase [Aquipluma nitroreducens]|uniref:histidine kinase n=1 Tax=Aquipluma nitroreducens TaxID=2010828 RepID=A0A5K7S3Y8_9BACT|nr:PAS domain-containing sensor histidine kinase [Aquipluma nitroreducens]BBE16246.1 histidine kinase [Aquipluma nitroreducens]